VNDACDGCRFGTEHEKLGYNLADNTRLGYEKIKVLLEGLCERFGWEPVMEGEYIIGAELDGANVSLEPGGQFELSGAPLDTLHKTCAEVANHLYQVQQLPIVRRAPSPSIPVSRAMPRCATAKPLFPHAENGIPAQTPCAE